MNFDVLFRYKITLGIPHDLLGFGVLSFLIGLIKLLVGLPLFDLSDENFILELVYNVVLFLDLSF